VGHAFCTVQDVSDAVLIHTLGLVVCTTGTCSGHPAVFIPSPKRVITWVHNASQHHSSFLRIRWITAPKASDKEKEEASNAFV